jgi:hypothetical protein
MPAPAVIAGLFGIGEKLIEHFFPDPTKAAEARMELIKLQESGELQRMAMENDLLKGQLDINKTEAATGSLFIGGWRPAIGWTCAISLFCYYVPYVLVATVLWAWRVIETGQLVARPDLGIADLIGLVMAMLGIAGMRTYEKKHSVASL